MALGKKAGTIIIGSGTVIALLLLFSVRWVYSFTDEIQNILRDNLSAYRVQESLGEEIRCFRAYMAERTEENREAYTAACAEAQEAVEQLPYVLERIGSERYALTWNITNSYTEYGRQRDKTAAMTGSEPDYISSLYETYDRQEYLEQYAMRLSRATLEQENSYYGENLGLFQQLPYVICGVAGIWVAVLSAFLWRAAKNSIITPLSRLVKATRRIEKNDFAGDDVVWEAKDEVGELVTAFNTMKHSMGNYVRTLEEKRQIEEQLYQKELEKANLEQRFSFAQLQLIKSQLNPHFLFNTLNMVARTAQLEEAPMTEEMLLALSNLLRYSLRTSEPFAPLDQELKVVEDYMYLQKMRFGDRIDWKISCDVENVQVYVPVFLIQPLVENAVLHGISSKEEGGSINVEVRGTDERLEISVADTGVGMDAEKLQRIRQAIGQRESGLGIGMGNIYRRISAYYTYGEVQVDSKEGEGTVVRIIFGGRK